MNSLTIQLFSLFYINELQNIEINQEIYELILNQFQRRIKRNLIDPFAVESSEDKIRFLRNSHLLSEEEKSSLFHLMLLYGYYEKLELRDALATLTHLKNPNQNYSIIQELLYSPIVDDISFNGTDLFTIYSQKYGTFSTQLASVVFQNEPNIKHYMEQNDCSKQCQMNTFFLALAKPDYDTVGTQCRYYFKGSYYHFYSYDQVHNQVIDLTLNSVMSKEQYEKLLEPRIILQRANYHLFEQMNGIKKKLEQHPSIRLTPLEYLTLYEQLKFESYDQKRYRYDWNNSKNSA